MGLATYPNKKPIKNYLWSEEIPSHWETIRLSFLIEMLVGNAFPSDKFEFEGRIRLVRGDNVTEGRLRWGDKQRCWPEVTKDIERYLLADGDVLIGMDGSKVGKNYAQVRLEDIPLLLVQRVARLRSSSRLYPSYLRYLIGSPLFLSWVEQRKTDPMVPHITAKDICDYRVCCPGYEEQKAIARFLDFKTAQIDTLVAKKQTLLEKLAEKRTALISHAVTKGLDPSAPMKDSGVVWLGSIPENWRLLPFRHLIMGGTQNGLYKTKDFFSKDGTAFIQMGEAFSEPVISKTAKDRVLLSDAELLQWGLKKGDLIFARRSLVFEGSGKCSVVGELQEPHVYESSMIRVRPNTEELNPLFAFYYFGSAFARAQMLATTKQVTISGIDSQQLKDVAVCVPPLDIQASIVAYIQDAEFQYSKASERIVSVISLLKEYRSALITHAVTGKIDVRGWQVPQEAT